MSIGKLYVSKTPKLSSTHFYTIPFTNAKLDYHSDSADSFSFQSNQALSQGTRVRYQDPRGNRYGFGGQIYKAKQGVDGIFEYDCVSYLRLYLSKIPSVSYSNITASKLLRKLLKNDPNNFSLAGIKKTTNKHSYLKWEKKSIWNIAKQLQYLEWKAGNPIECYVDIYGVLHFGKKINTTKGYQFTAGGEGTNAIIDYEETLTTDNVVTVGRVIYNGNTRASATASREMLATWGYIEGDAFDCTESVSKGSGSSGAATNADGQAFINKYNINSKIVKQANNIISDAGAKSDKAKAKAVWSWMRKNIDYNYYACTKKNALGTLNARKGNCADQTHLYMSLAGSVGLTVRCNHISGHFYPQTKINGKWFATDTTTRRGWGGHWGNGRHLAYYYSPLSFNC